jgi:energy-coupling factor transporter ATP-binding protein EcfA2
MTAYDTFASAKRPFIGLRPFAYPDREFFFGRKPELDALEPLIARNRFVAIVGSSGSGKSSLIRAGLRPRLEAATDREWVWVEMHPGDAPIRELALGLARLANGADDLADAWADRLELLLRRSSFGIGECVSLFPALKQKRLLLLVDQFEELFRFADLRAERNHDTTTAAEHRDEATSFVRLLLTAMNSRELSIHIVVTMRSDFIGDCARFHDLPEAATRSQFLVPGLTRDQRAAVIGGPVERAGGQVDSGLVQRALNDTNEDPDQLPVLQHALMRCWERASARTDPQTGKGPNLTLDDYNKVGGVAKALSIHANEILDGLTKHGASTEILQVTKRIFQALTETDQDGRVLRRPQRFGNLVKHIGTEGEADEERRREVRTVVDRLASPDCSFLRAPPDSELHDDSIVDIGHEALIRRWEMLKGDGNTDWIREEQDDAEQYRDLLRDLRGNGIIPPDKLPDIERWWSKRKPNVFGLGVTPKTVRTSSMP